MQHLVFAYDFVRAAFVWVFICQQHFHRCELYLS
jgi:hypothetical protein